MSPSSKEAQHQTCHYCRRTAPTKNISTIANPQDHEICDECWERMKPEQSNPDTRTVVYYEDWRE